MDMNKDEILKTITEAINDSVRPAIEEYVNGGIRKVDAKIDEQNTKFNKHVATTEQYRTDMYAFMERMEPVEQGLVTFQNLVKFFKFLGLPAIGVFLLWLYQKIS